MFRLPGGRQFCDVIGRTDGCRRLKQHAESPKHRGQAPAQRRECGRARTTVAVIARNPESMQARRASPGSTRCQGL